MIYPPISQKEPRVSDMDHALKYLMATIPLTLPPESTKLPLPFRTTNKKEAFHSDTTETNLNILIISNNWKELQQLTL
jgi:hypothetical protein